jgi:hypothetical protein
LARAKELFQKWSWILVPISTQSLVFCR